MISWTKEEIDTLLQNCNRVSNEDLQLMIPNKSAIAIYKKTYKMGLRKTPEIEFLNRSLARRGEKCNLWNGGVSVTKKGYRLIKMPDHHRASSKGYVMEHIVVFEKESGITLPDNC